ncbi:NAD(P)/FAD-dependent oxidoreductase [Peptoniphilus sp.]|uniref:NAD(P)/FAD-dependent oxidoreductase n=1 Tax=Peptoniphilus sp. TaxID=1971214 RepID=UPI00399570D0
MKVAIIGGGAAGIFSALVASEKHEVTIFERNNRIGKKLLATGNGRCNLTNVSVERKNFHGDGNFAYKIYKKFDNETAVKYFEDLGILTTTKESGKIYPRSLTAASVLNVFLEELENRNIEVKTDKYINKIEKIKNRFKIHTKEESYTFDRVIMATGGMSMASSGSDGNGYKLLKDLGHTVLETHPALVQLKLKSNFLKHLSGTKVEGVCYLLKDGKVIKERSGDILFTDYGISGPPILDLSRYVLDGNYRLRFSIVNDLMTEEDKNDFLEYFYRTISSKDMTLERFLIGILNKKFIHYVLKTLDLDRNMKVMDLDQSKSYELLKILTESEFEIIGNNGYKNSQVTVGGISIKEINENMESKIVNGLYIIGEILNIDGDCGGYNLQWAWSSAYVAAYSI